MLCKTSPDAVILHQVHVKHEEDVPTVGLMDSSSMAHTPHPTLSKAVLSSKMADSSSNATDITVRTFTDSSGGAILLGGVDEHQEEEQQLARPGSSVLQDSASSCEEWYDCAEDWQEDAARTAETASDKTQQQAAQDHFAGLPAELARILRRYTEVRHAADLAHLCAGSSSPLQHGHTLPPLHGCKRAA